MHCQRNLNGQIDSRAWSNAAYNWTGGATVTHSYTANALNQLATNDTSSSSLTLAYGPKGNMTSDGVNTYTYDIADELLTMNGASLTYDALGRLASTTGTAVTQFAYSGSQAIAEYDGSGNLLRRYVPGAGVWYEGTAEAERRWMLTDERGSVIAVTSATGAPVQINTYDEFGIPGASNLGRYQYAGQMWIPEDGLYHDNARAYSPTLGRFMQPDPTGIAGGMNIYAYAGSDPINGIDPTGLDDNSGVFSGGGGSGGGGGAATTVSPITVSPSATPLAPQATVSPEVPAGAVSMAGPPVDPYGTTVTDVAQIVVTALKAHLQQLMVDTGPQSNDTGQQNTKTCAPGDRFAQVGSKTNLPNGYYYRSASLGILAGLGGQVSFITGIHVSGGVVVGSYNGFSFLAGVGVEAVAGGSINASDVNPLGSGLTLTGQLGGGPASYSASINNSGNFAGQSAGAGPVADIGVAGGLSGSRVTCQIGS
jgi:RHS repeat-associated protein